MHLCLLALISDPWKTILLRHVYPVRPNCPKRRLNQCRAKMSYARIKHIRNHIKVAMGLRGEGSSSKEIEQLKPTSLEGFLLGFFVTTVRTKKM